MNELETYYNKFNEDKRLLTRRGQVEYVTTMKYIKKYLRSDSKIIEIGAGTGAYSIALFNDNYDITAVELVKHNLKVINKKEPNLKTILGNATNLEKIENDYYDLVLLLGPMYHLQSKEDKIKALNEAKRIVKKDGIIMVAYCMNEYALLTHGIKDNNLKECIKLGQIDENFHITNKGNSLYSYVRIEDINELNDIVSLKRVKIIAADGPSSYLKQYLNKMDEETFEIYLSYHLKTCERLDLIGASTHTLDILKKQ